MIIAMGSINALIDGVIAARFIDIRRFLFKRDLFKLRRTALPVLPIINITGRPRRVVQKRVIVDESFSYRCGLTIRSLSP